MKRLYRSRKDRTIAGVAGGMAAYFEIDPVLMRVLWGIALIVTCFTAIFAYLLCWAIIPEEPAA